MESTGTAPQHVEWKPTHSPWLIAFSVLCATFMEVLDTSIANVALPHIAGTLSASVDEATWVLTSYLVANAIILPAASWLAQRLPMGRVASGRDWGAGSCSSMPSSSATATATCSGGRSATMRDDSTSCERRSVSSASKGGE